MGIVVNSVRADMGRLGKKGQEYNQHSNLTGCPNGGSEINVLLRL